MPRTIEQGFGEFLQKLTPSEAETQAASDHRASIESCLQTNFGMTRFFRTGSFGNGTSVYKYSDVDYFAEIPPANLHKDSSVSLAKIRGALAYTFWDTDVRVATPAIKLPFSNGDETTEIVPAYKIEDGKWGTVYGIPNTNNGWMKSSPETHKAFVKYWDKQLDMRVRPLIRFIKAWKYENQVPISSFYLELEIASYAKAEAQAQRHILYSFDVQIILHHLLQKRLVDISDPMGVSGQICACTTRSQYEDALSKLETGFSRADKALIASKGNSFNDAFEYWKLLFGSSFPNYYYP